MEIIFYQETFISQVCLINLCYVYNKEEDNMDYENPEESKIKIEETTNGTLFQVFPEKKWSMIIFMSFWMIGWAVGEVSAITMIIAFFSSSDNEMVIGFAQIFMIAWLGGWTVGGFFALKTLLWQLAGKELITVNHDAISIQTDNVIYKKEKSYSRNYIKDLRLNPGNDHPFKQLNIGKQNDGKIAFDYGAKTIKFGVMSEDAEAKKVINHIQKKYSYY